VTTPNILWIVTDHQLHASAPVCLGLPALQRRLSDSGTRFSRAYSVLPICSPARATMLTGLYPHAHGLTENDGRFGGREGLNPQDWTIRDSLSSAGYQCAWFGKWHVDNNHSAADYGFTGFSLPGYGYPYATVEYRQYLKQNGLAHPRVRVEIGGECGTRPGDVIDLCDQSAWFEYESGVAILDDHRAHEAWFIADQVKHWLRERGANHAGSPWFARVDSWGPHPPYVVADPFLDSCRDADINMPAGFHHTLSDRPQHHRDYRDYWQQTLALDHEQWRMMYQRALEHRYLVEAALVSVLDEIDLQNTLVIFCSDHGDAIAANGAVSNKGGLMCEPTMRIPLLMAGTGVASGRVCDELVSNLDLMSTVLDFAHVDPPVALHGSSLRSLVSEVEGHTNEFSREGLLLQHSGLHEHLPQRAWYQDQWKMVVQADGFVELYDLRDDPHELQNLARQAAFDPLIAELGQALRARLVEIDDPFLLSSANAG
jgi:arylsulfatase A-like enzyme